MDLMFFDLTQQDAGGSFATLRMTGGRLRTTMGGSRGQDRAQYNGMDPRLRGDDNKGKGEVPEDETGHSKTEWIPAFAGMTTRGKGILRYAQDDRGSAQGDRESAQDDGLRGSDALSTIANPIFRIDGRVATIKFITVRMIPAPRKSPGKLNFIKAPQSA